MKKWSKTTVILISVVAIFISTLWVTMAFGLWVNGMSYITSNTKEFTDVKGHMISDEYTLTIDLNDLQSNIGKELYSDSNSKIYVDWIDNTGSLNTGGYRIGFRSCGQYSLSKAILVSGIRHITVDDTTFMSNMSATMTSKYNGKVYSSRIFSTCGVIYKDGDDFSFYIFPTEAYKSGEVSFNEKGVVEISIKNLYKNIWTKK